MDADQHASNVQSDTEFQTLLTELINIKNKYVDPTLNFYNTHGKLPMILFSIFGVITILLSVSLPVLASLKETWGTLVVQIVAVLVAGSTSLMQFFRWESIWKGYSQSGQALNYLLTIWELKITLAKHERDTQKAIDMAVGATQQLIEASHTTIGSEAEEYFQRFQIPRTQQGQ
jgi:hypothetical protein